MQTRWRVRTDCCRASAVLLCSVSSAASAACILRSADCGGGGGDAMTTGSDEGQGGGDCVGWRVIRVPRLRPAANSYQLPATSLPQKSVCV